MSENGYRDSGGWAAPGGGQGDGSSRAPGWSGAPTGENAPTGWGAAPAGWNAPGQSGNGQGWNGHGGNAQGGGQGWFAPPKPGVIPLRPLSVGEVLDGSLQAARRNAKAMIGSSLLFNVVMGLLVILFVLTAGAPFLRIASMGANSSTFSRSEASSLLASIPILLIGELLIAVLALVGGAVLQGALVIPVSRAVLEQRTGFRQMWGLVRPRIGALIGLALFLAGIGFGASIALMVVLFAVGAVISSTANDATGAIIVFLLTMLALAVLAAWVGTRLSVCGAVVVLEKCGPGQALARSWRLTKGNFWRVFGTLLLTVVLVYVVSAIAGAPLQFALPLLTGVLAPTGAGLGSGAVGLLIALLVAYLVLTTLVGALTTVFLVGVTSLLYVDLRMRREGLDMALMAEHDRLASGSHPSALPGTA
ncbi:glycerophosphoryl diester phosphodiesterase membrane domain-containing protein [Tersicoccus sp. Bi-70]|uniref:glycerophosphoryl diester phosphodiesterase membrane domain-containing protein n=1 Tax=Tersicoccus sp. Bi-70 TaxID=1897634 RepID=UPI0009761182|nr:glycerophosphoryl diester phosphodiesterase membrane domain-containing protein [Tersicoccus sp. Bi-70]OMH35161.1 hypothetical protein BGP79_02330 [Tersicoccus sp. Bi-70]